MEVTVFPAMLIIKTILSIAVVPVLLVILRYVLGRSNTRREVRVSKRDELRQTCIDLQCQVVDAVCGCQRVAGLKPRFGWMPLSVPTLRALDETRGHVSAATRLRVQLRTAASTEVGDAADGLMDRVIEAVGLMQEPKANADWVSLWDSVADSRRRFDAAAVLAKT
jgi:hypothetical protein